MNDISDDDVDPSPTNPLDAVDPGFRYEPKMVRLEWWQYPRKGADPDDEDPRVRRLRARMQYPIEEVD